MNLSIKDKTFENFSTNSQKRELSVTSSNENLQENVSNQQQRLANYYETAAFELLSICNTLYTKASTIYKDWEMFEWNEKSVGCGNYDLEMLWYNCWCPLLQAMARYKFYLYFYKDYC